MDKQAILSVLEELKPLLHEKFKITEIGLFGSYAKSKQRPNSDVDIIISVESHHELGWEDLISLETILQKSLSVDRIDLVNKKYLNPVIALDIEDSLIYA